MTHQARHFRHGLPQSLQTAMPWPICKRRTRHPISRQRRRESMSLRGLRPRLRDKPRHDDAQPQQRRDALRADAD